MELAWKSKCVLAYYLDLQGNCLFVNRRWLEITKLSPDDALGKGWIAAIHPDDRDWLSSKFCSSDRPQELAIEYRYCTPDNGVTWVFANLQLIGDAGGISSLYVGTIADITHQKLTTISIQERLRDLATASVGIALLDACGCYTYLNPAYSQIFGYESADLLLGKSWDTLYYPAEINWMKSQIFPWLKQQGSWQGHRANA
jgi:PAS domain S-box-containing protein